MTLAIVHVSIDTLKLDPRNPRRHSDRQVAQIARSIKSFGFIVPVLIDGANNVLAGHGRVMAARKISLLEVPVIRLEHLSEAQARTFAIADNRLTENSEWNDRLLGEIFLDLSAQHLDFSLEATGFTLDEIALCIAGLQDGPEVDPADQIPDMPEGPTVSRIGDQWLLNEHRLLCGDAIKLADIGRLMNGAKASMTFTDPPYGVDYGNTPKDKLRGSHRPILNDNLGRDFEPFLFAACSNILSITDGAAYICMSSSELHTLYKAFAAAGGHWSTFIIWAKNTFTLGRADYQRQYEPILYGWREGIERHWCGARDQGDVWLFDKPAKNDLHPTQKPVELVMRAIRNSSERGSIVLDPFMGSGSTLIAAERTGRTCYGMELDPAYVDTIIRRWQRHTGDSAIHTGIGKRFDDLAIEARAGSHG